MQVFLYLSVKNNDLNELNAINRLCEHLALNDKSLALKASGVEFNHSYALYTYECGNYAELKERLKEAVCQKLFDFVYDDLKKNMVENFSLEVNINNKSAINFYLKNGFEIKSIRKNYYGNDDAYLMVLEVK